MKKLTPLIPLIAVVAMFFATAQANAQAKPVVVVSFAGYDELMADIDFVGQLSGIPGLSAETIDQQVKMVTQGQGFKGLDKKRPWGAALFFDGFAPKFSVFAPVSNVKNLVDAFAGSPVPFSTKDAGNGVVELRGPMPQSGFAKSQGNYTFFAQSAADLGQLPPALLENPETWLDGLNKDYDIAVRAYIQNIPEAFRQQMLMALQMGVQMGLQPNPNEDPQAFQLRKQLLQSQMKQMETLFKELNTFTIGAKLDGSAKTAHLDIGMTVAENSELAKQFAQSADLKTDHAGFLLPDAAFSMTVVGVAQKNDIDQAVTMLKSVEQQAINQIDQEGGFPNEATRKTAKEIVADLMSVAVKTLQGGKIDGSEPSLAPQSATLVVGGSVVDPATVESALKKFVEMAKSEIPGEVKFNAGKINDITLHTFSMPIPDEGAQKAFGPTADVVFGIGTKTVHIAAGRNASDALKKVVDQSAADAAKAVPPFQAIVALSPILKFVNSIEPNPEAAAVADSLAATPGKDHVSIVAQLQKNGFVYRLKAEEGVLRAIGSAIRMAH